MSDERITIGDVRRAGYCVLGARKWCRQNGIDFKIFVKRGFPVSELHDLKNDAVVQQILRIKGEGRNG